MSWSLYVPAPLDTGERDAARMIFSVPLALSAGGVVREALEGLARDKAEPLDIALDCTSYQHAYEALRTDRFAAVLPSMVADYLPGDGYRCLKLKDLSQATRRLRLAWATRTARTRPSVRDALPVLRDVLAF